MFSHFSAYKMCSMCILLLGAQLVVMTTGQTYSDVYNLQQKLFENYSTSVRPVLDQTKPLDIRATFELINILSVNEIQMSFTVNGILVINWTDELLQWDPASHNNISVIYPDTEAIWRLPLILVNTLDQADVFEDFYAPTAVSSNGGVVWAPSGGFPATCSLDLERFPYDRQHCSLVFMPFRVALTDFNLTTTAPNSVGLDWYTVNGGWDLESATVNIAITLLRGTPVYGIEVSFQIRRRPSFFVVNILIPVIILSALDLIVFFIPVESGERIGYSTTVLLSMTMYMTVTSSILPAVSEPMPVITYYLTVLLFMGVLAVMDTILIVWLHHKEEEEGKRQKRKSTLMKAIRKLRLFNTATHPEEGSQQDASPSRPIKPIHFGLNLNKVASSAGVQSQDLPAQATTDSRFQPQLDQRLFKMAGDDQSDSLQPVFSSHGVEEDGSVADNPGIFSSSAAERRKNKYRLIGKHVDSVSFVVFLTVYISASIWLLVSLHT